MPINLILKMLIPFVPIIRFYIKNQIKLNKDDIIALLNKKIDLPYMTEIQEKLLITVILEIVDTL